MNFGQVFEQGNPVLIVTFLVLIAMSFASWYIIFWKGYALKKERANYENFRYRYIKTPDWPKHTSFNNITGNISLLVDEAQRLSAVLSSHSKEEKKEILAMHLSQQLDVAKIRLDKGLTVLASVGSSAPFIGLFGTVWGIYGALTKIAAEGNAGLNVVAGPMGEALVATAVGLFAAIPAVLAYNAFVRLNRLLVQDLRHIAEQMTTYLSFSEISTGDRVAFLKGAS